MRSNVVAEFRNEAARDAAQLVAAQAFRVADDAALAAAVGNIDDGRLPGHECGQRRDLGLADVRVVADSSLAGAPHVAVQNAKSVKGLDGAVVHVNGKADVDRAFGVDQEVDNAFLDPVDPAQGSFELLSSVHKEVETLGLSYGHIHDAPRWI